jgi:hypothetical protein
MRTARTVQLWIEVAIFATLGLSAWIVIHGLLGAVS